MGTGAGKPRSMDRGRVDSHLLTILDADWEDARNRAGDHLKCEQGCSECCHSLFPITRLDTWRLRRGMQTLTESHPDVADEIRRRAREAVDRFRIGFPGDPETGRLVNDDERLDLFFKEQDGAPCPALDPVSQGCLLYTSRPVACRTYGPPMRFGSEDSAPCELCFTGTTAEVVEACRYQPDVGGIEEWILEQMGVEAGRELESLIAYALAFEGEDSGKVAGGGDDG
ncbi:MAG: YkgJ family cysteine cluster protein [Acidobacteriota bacterium]|nr:YkgJ family cysteine cluster protein [Acidobacteriota bacterium]MDH3784490.1 YkgJ family cysteine cluster protein [Acidobacteriota bacterium]